MEELAACQGAASAGRCQPTRTRLPPYLAFRSGKLLSCSSENGARHRQEAERLMVLWPELHDEERSTVQECRRSLATRALVLQPHSAWCCPPRPSRPGSCSATSQRVVLSTQTLQVWILVWDAPVPEPAWPSHAARTRVTCLGRRVEPCFRGSTPLCSALSGLRHAPVTLAETRQMGKLPDGIRQVELQGDTVVTS